MNTSAISSVAANPVQVDFERPRPAPAAGSRGGAFNAASLRHASPAEQGRAVAAQVEAILVRQLLGKTMSSMLGGEGNVSGSVYGDMMADTLSQQLTAGPGLGLGRFLEQQLTPAGALAAGETPSSSPTP